MSSYILLLTIVLCMSVSCGQSASLVIGAAGFVGYHLSATMKSSGFDVIAMDSFQDEFYSMTKYRRAWNLLLSHHIDIKRWDVCSDGLVPFLITFLSSANITSVVYLRNNYRLQGDKRCLHNVWQALGSATSSSGECIPLVYVNVPPCDLTLHGRGNSTSSSDDILLSWTHERVPIIRIQLPSYLMLGSWPQLDYTTIGTLPSSNSDEDGLLYLYKNFIRKRSFVSVQEVVDKIVQILRRPHSASCPHNPRGALQAVRSSLSWIASVIFGKSLNTQNASQVIRTIGGRHRQYNLSLAVCHSSEAQFRTRLNQSKLYSEGTNTSDAMYACERTLERNSQWITKNESSHIRLPCASKCSLGKDCVETGFDQAAIVSRRLTEGCGIVYYTIGMHREQSYLTAVPEEMDKRCYVAFIKDGSPISRKNLDRSNGWYLVTVNPRHLDEFGVGRRTS